jgi:hypothetical protein
MKDEKEKTLNYSRYSDVLESILEDFYEQNKQEKTPETQAKLDAISWSLDALRVIFNIDYHLKELERLSENINNKE